MEKINYCKCKPIGIFDKGDIEEKKDEKFKFQI